MSRLRCRSCGDEITRLPGPGRDPIWCGICRFHLKAPKPPLPVVSEEERAARAKERQKRAYRKRRAAAVAAHPGKCEFCSKPMDVVNGRLKRFCSTLCSLGYLAPSGSLPPRKCPECTKSFVPKHSNHKFCAVSCSRRHRDRPRSAARRARVSDGEKVNPIEVFMRDSWKCQLCGVKTPRKLRGTFEARAPELDHIVPLNEGGAHTYRNTQCACRQCNARKQDKPLGQQRLFG